MAEPQIIVGHEAGHHNTEVDQTERLLKKRTYQDLSTICVIPTRGLIASRVVESWWGMMTPMNQKFTRIVIKGMEVGAAYNAAIEIILNNEELSKWKYVLTLEEDNLPPPDGLLKLLESIEGYGAVGGLYWTKGEEGQPMIYGDPQGVLNFRPQMPIPDSLQECNGLGMGFTLFDMDVFRKVEPPWFVTQQDYSREVGVKMYTQDLYFFERLRGAGYKVASDTRVKVGHMDVDADFVW